MKLTTTATLLVALFTINTSSHAADNHSHDSHAQHNASKQTMGDDMHGGMSQQGMYLVEKEVDGYKVSFHVMEATAAMHHGGSHNLMIKIEKDGKTIDDAKINSKVIHPNKQEESKGLMKMGDWYMNGYDLSHNGQHQLMILFKTADGQKHKAGVYYPE